ncbi:MAG: serine hydrolase [Bacteroidetes bacterium]|nr:serine hydrolase [Bacteroidota bacterium]
MHRFKCFLFSSLYILFLLPSQAQLSYFPPLVGNQWDQASFQDFPYDSSFTDSLYSYLENNKTKAFLVVYDGRIVKEKYFGNFTQDSFWYWASAGKTLVSFLYGVARDKGLVEVGLPISSYLGVGWSSCTPQQEAQIKVWHLLTMSSGLDGQVPDPDCTDPACLVYKGEPGTLWYYHNAAYYLTHHVLDSASGMSLQNFMTQNLSIKTGITGLWANTLFISKPRSAARFGMLMLNKGIWNGDTIVHDRVYLDSMTTSSQVMNPAYGLLTWLNGKDTIMLPQSTVRLALPLNAAAPSDMYAALGKNDQKIYVVPSQKLVIVRMGDDPGTGVLGPSSFDQLLWEHINRWRQMPSGIASIDAKIQVYPNPCNQILRIPEGIESIRVFDLQGKEYFPDRFGSEINTSSIANGIYLLQLQQDANLSSIRFQVQH